MQVARAVAATGASKKLLLFLRAHHAQKTVLTVVELMEEHHECMKWKTLAFGTMVMLAQNADIEFMSIDSCNPEQ